MSPSAYAVAIDLAQTFDRVRQAYPATRTLQLHASWTDDTGTDLIMHIAIDDEDDGEDFDVPDDLSTLSEETA